MKKAGSLLDHAIKRAGIDRQVQGQQALTAFSQALEETLGAKAVKQATPRSLHQGELTVAVHSSALANEIRVQEKNLLDNTNKKLGQPIIRYLRLVA
jgi:predicted nucleic acid-binding Zn ribbon protein